MPGAMEAGSSVFSSPMFLITQVRITFSSKWKRSPLLSPSDSWQGSVPQKVSLNAQAPESFVLFFLFSLVLPTGNKTFENWASSKYL